MDMSKPWHEHAPTDFATACEKYKQHVRTYGTMNAQIVMNVAMEIDVSEPKMISWLATEFQTEVKGVEG